jgi:hypothetical protein
MRHISMVYGVVFWALIGCKTTQKVTDTVDLNLPKQALYQNIKMDEGLAILTGPCEPSIAFNLQNPQNLVAGSVLNNVYYSQDAGRTWTKKLLKSKSFGVYGDPCIVNDPSGNFYYLHLANPDGQAYAGSKFLNQIVIQKSTDGGQTWNDGVGIGKNEPKQQDKEWAVVHPTTGQIYVTWTEFDKYGSANTEHKSRIQFATSTDAGATFSEAITISNLEGDALDDDKTTEGAVPAVDTDGNVYVAWSVNNQIHFDKSLDNGITWIEDTVIADQTGGWTQDIPGIGRCNGMPVTVVDVSNSPFKGNIYINWTDQRNGKDNTDVFLIKSSDAGVTWSQPIRVNQDKTLSHQFFTWMSVDPITGYIYIVYYDRSRYSDTQTDVVLSVSTDGGTTFSSECISSSPFTPNPDIFFGDYNNISSYNGMVRPIWTRSENGKLSIWTAMVKK